MAADWTWDDAKELGLMAIESDPQLKAYWDTRDLTALENGLKDLGIPFAGVRVGMNTLKTESTLKRNLNATNYPQPVWGTKAVEFAARLREYHASLYAMRPYGDLHGVWLEAQTDIDVALTQVFLLGWMVKDEQGESDDIISAMFADYDVMGKPTASVQKAIELDPPVEKRHPTPKEPEVKLVSIGVTKEGNPVWGPNLESDPNVISTAHVRVGVKHSMVVVRRKSNNSIGLASMESPDVRDEHGYEIIGWFPQMFAA